MKSKRSWDVFWALKHFKGSDVWDNYYSDGEKTIIRAVRAAGVNHENAQPGVSRSNAIIEARIGSVEDSIRACCVTGGLPACCWSFLGCVIAVLRNTFVHDDGLSAWCKTFGEPFE